MLEPQTRQVYLEALRPPDGYELDRAVATTFGLDLLALLVAPVSFALFDCDGWEDALRDPLALLQALQRHAERITLFCQQGQIHVPLGPHPLYGQIEEMVVEVTAPTPGGVFHPKTWTLRYVNEHGDAWYRFLCLTRNLTFDRSWDLVFAAEGPLEDDTDTRIDAGPIGDFLEALPALATETVAPRIAANVTQMAAEIRHAALRPDGNGPFEASAIRFHPIGIGGYQRWVLPRQLDRCLVVSPFLSDGALRRITETGRNHVLVSQPESVDVLAASVVERFYEILVLDDAADTQNAPASGGEPTVDTDDTDTVAGVEAVDEARGLHAKLFVTEHGDTARLWIGSANATAAALMQDVRDETGRNVEFLVELAAPARNVGIDAILAPGSAGAGFRDLLVPWRPPEEPPEPDPDRVALEEHLAACARTVAASGPRLTARESGDDRFDLLLAWERDPTEALQDVTVRCWPVTMAESAGTNPLAESSGPVKIASLSTLGLSRFLAFHLRARRGALVAHHRFVLRLPLDGAPADRQARLLQHLLSDRARFVRYLLMLLGDQSAATLVSASQIRDGGNGPNGDGNGHLVAMPLLEELVRALARHPESIGRVKRLVDELRSVPDGTAVLPEGFGAVWAPIEDAWNGDSAS